MRSADVNGAPAPRRPEVDVYSLHIEAEENYVAIPHDVVFSFKAQLARFASFRQRTERDEIVIMNCFRRDKTTLEIGMNHSRGRGCLVSGVNRPDPRLFFSRGEKRSQTKQMINGPDECIDAAVFNAQAAQVFHRFIFAKIDKFTFDLRADDDSLRSEMMLRIILDKIDTLRGAVTGIVDPGYSSNRGQIGFGNVAGENGRLRCEQK